MASAGGRAGPATRLFGDATIVFVLLNEVRHRIVARLFGISRRDSNMVTGVATAAALGGVAAAAARARPSGRPSFAASLMGAAAVKEAGHSIAGDWSRRTPLFVTIVGLILLEKSFGPAIRSSLRGSREVFRGVEKTLKSLRTVLEGEEEPDPEPLRSR